ncbi:MAG: ABC transporter substrate-binding protein, partial [Candidatus Bathyarchaeota archaeon]|nr:ABC transporter substrate-binding protein [Candidatus Bathyarchaeota archaeon]
GRYVYWLYNYLHSDSIKSGAWNFAGISDSLFDQWTMSILTSVNEDEVIGNASLVQARFVYELMPWLPISCEMTFCTTANDSRGELVGIVSMPNLGPANDWSWMTAHWKDSTGGTVKVALTNTVHSMNPYNEDSVYGWRILDRSIAGLLGVSPITLTETPLVATEWSCTPWVSIPELGIVDGTILTFYLRQDVYWHDGKQVTAYDCVNNLKLLRKYRPGRYARVWASQAYEEVQGPYKFSTYSYTQGIYYAYDVADVALLSPKHITDAAEAMYGSILTGWDPAFNSYKALLGVDPPTEYPFMKQIVGCGPYVFDYYDKDIDLGRVVKYDDFFVKAPVISAVVGDWWIGSIAAGWEPSLSYPYTYKVLVQNIGAQANSSDSELVSVTVDVKVYEDNVLMHTESDIVLDPWSYTYLGPYTTDPVIGLHEIKVEILESGNVIHTYIHKYVAVVRQDITSYSGDFVDCFVDVKDLLRAAIAYGSYPGSSKWDAACDINDDYFVGIKDILSTVFVYGWHA